MVSPPKHTLSFFATTVSLCAYGVHANSSAKLRGSAINNEAAAGHRILTPIHSPQQVDPCSGGGADGFLNYQCEGTAKFHQCNGKKSALFHCAPGTTCQCGPGVLTSSNPCGSNWSPSPCEAPKLEEVTVNKPECPNGWTPYGEDKCLKTVDQGDSFEGHEANCQQIAPDGWLGSLVSFHSQEDLNEAGAVCDASFRNVGVCVRASGVTCRTGLRHDANGTDTFTDGSPVDYFPINDHAHSGGTIFSFPPGFGEQCAILSTPYWGESCSGIRAGFGEYAGCDSNESKDKGLCQIWLA